MSDKFLWYKSNSKETGTTLAAALGFGDNHGTVPPRNFNGTLVCWGASPGKDFKWENRNIRAIFNDPREVRKYTDRKIMFDKLQEAGINVISCVPLTAAAQYTNICNILAATEAEGFVACKESGASIRFIDSQASLTTALTAGCVRALDPRFAGTSRIRIFVVDGVVIGALQRTPDAADATFIQRASAEAGTDTNHAQPAIATILQLLLEKKLVVPGKSYWAPYAPTGTAKTTVALAVASALGLSFCAIDIEIGAGRHDVVNVVTTPDLVNTTTILTPIVNAITTWVTQNSMTAREILQVMINDSTDQEADAILEELRNIKAQVTNAAAG